MPNGFLAFGVRPVNVQYMVWAFGGGPRDPVPCEKHKSSDDVCQARQGRGVFPACLTARSSSLARRSYLSAGLYLLLRVSIPGPAGAMGTMGA